MDGYDLLVIGGGAAGINALKVATKAGARVALVDTGPWVAPAPYIRATASGCSRLSARICASTASRRHVPRKLRA